MVGGKRALRQAGLEIALNPLAALFGGVSPAGRSTHAPTLTTLRQAENHAAHRMLTINIPTVELAKTVVACGNTSGSSMDKFKKFGLTALPAKFVKAPLIAECYAGLECKVVDMKLVTKYNFFVLEVVQAWIDPARKTHRTIHHQGEGEFMVAGRTLHLPSPKTSLG